MPRHFETYPTLAGAGWPVMAAGTQYTQGDLNIEVLYIQGDLNIEILYIQGVL